MLYKPLWKHQNILEPLEIPWKTQQTGMDYERTTYVVTWHLLASDRRRLQRLAGEEVKLKDSTERVVERVLRVWGILRDVVLQIKSFWDGRMINDVHNTVYNMNDRSAWALFTRIILS